MEEKKVFISPVGYKTSLKKNTPKTAMFYHIKKKKKKKKKIKRRDYLEK